MSTKKNTKLAPVHTSSDILWEGKVPGESDSRTDTRALLNPCVQAGHTIRAVGKFKSDMLDFVAELHEQIDAVNRGDMKRPEAMLFTQAHTLNEVFNGLAKRAFNQENIKRLESFMRLALKAQTQCRATLETLANIKNPPIVYTRQANITSGPQQVNNEASSHTGN